INDRIGVLTQPRWKAAVPGSPGVASGCGLCQRPFTMPAVRRFSTRTKVFLVVGLSLIALCAVWAIPTIGDERTLLLFSQPGGRVSVGSKFGVTIGDPWTRADRALRSRFKLDDVSWEYGHVHPEGDPNVRSADGPVLTGEAVVSYKDNSWHNGVVSIDL